MWADHQCNSWCHHSPVVNGHLPGWPRACCSSSLPRSTALRMGRSLSWCCTPSCSSSHPQSPGPWNPQGNTRSGLGWWLLGLKSIGYPIHKLSKSRFQKSKYHCFLPDFAELNILIHSKKFQSAHGTISLWHLPMTTLQARLSLSESS